MPRLLLLPALLALGLLPAGALGEVSSSPWTCPAIPPAQVSPSDAAWTTKPHVNGNVAFIGGRVVDWAGDSIPVSSPIVDSTTGERAVIGSLSSMGESGALEALEAASAAWDMGQGEWPQMSLAERIARIEAVVSDLQVSPIMARTQRPTTGPNHRPNSTHRPTTDHLTIIHLATKPPTDSGGA